MCQLSHGAHSSFPPQKSAFWVEKGYLVKQVFSALFDGVKPSPSQPSQLCPQEPQGTSLHPIPTPQWEGRSLGVSRGKENVKLPN